MVRMQEGPRPQQQHVTDMRGHRAKEEPPVSYRHNTCIESIVWLMSLIKQHNTQPFRWGQVGVLPYPPPPLPAATP